MSLLTPIVKTNTPEELTEGEYLAILFRIVEKGTQDELFKQNNQIYKRKKVLFTWVLPEQFQLIQQQSVPIIVHKEYTQSLHQSSFLYRDVIDMRGFDFSEQELAYPFDLLSLLGIPCLLTIKPHKNSDTTYFEVKKVQTPKEGSDIPESPYQLYSLTFSDWNWELYDELSSKLRDEIALSPEFAQLPPRL